ncbi:MAG: protein O-mannosyl-transferase family [Parabacteroides sp.]
MAKYKLINNVLGWVVFVIASAVYLLTMEPTASFWDCGEFISSAFKLEVGHPPGAPFFMLVANLFTQFASDPSKVAVMVNTMSALASGLTILFLFWSITHMARKIMVDRLEEMTLAQMITILGSGLVGALAYTFSDTFWFSAVEGEVYASSSLFTAVVFWLILKWEEVADQPHADRWIVLIAYLMGLSIGVHLLNLLCIPAIVLVYYYKKVEEPTMKGTVAALVISFAIVALMMYGVVQGLVEVCGYFELFFVNVLSMPYNTGVYVFVIVLAAVLAWSIWETMREEVNPVRMKIAFILSVILIGIPFIGSGYVVAVILTAALTAWLFMQKDVNIKILNTVLVCLMVIVVGYSSYALTLIRATADTPMNQNTPSDIFTLRTYLAREQYGKTPLIYGQTYVSEVKRENQGGNCVAVTKQGAPTYSRVIKQNENEKDHYYISRYETEYEYADELNMLFPRMFSSDPRHVSAYKEWAQIKGEPVKYNRCGEMTTVMKPTFGENLRFFFTYQLNFMYWRYFMWNFSGRQNDIQGHGEVLNGNWITGIKFIDEAMVGPQEDMPSDIIDNKGHNVYYMLPLLLGLLGLFYQAYAGKKGIQGFWVTFFLFFMTGIAIVLYLNQTPYQPRERDYAYAGSFYAFCIWIGFGVAALAKGLQQYGKLPAVAAASVATLVSLFVPIQMGAQNWDDHDRSGRYVCRDFGSNYLESCEPNAVIFTNGDNDTFPLWYAQEVEGIRTDVRVCNTSYLQTDWYIDQMKKQAYESDPLPISWTRADYVQGTRDAAYIFPMTDQPIDLGTALDFVRSNDPKFKKIPGYSQQLDYIPSQTLTYQVDSAAVMAAGVISPADTAYLLKQMTINLKDKDYLGKQELAILDMLRTNNWQRPIYYAITVSPDQFVKLDPFFQQTGLAYQLVPMDVKGTARSVNTDKMYDNVMNKFKWGGVDKPGIYLDENVMRMCKSYRAYVFGRLAASLIAEGKKDKALNVLDKAMQVLPPENVPLDYSALSLAEMYYELGQQEKAEAIYSGIADGAMRNVNWFFRLSPQQFTSVLGELEHNLAVVQEILRVSKRYNPEFGKKYQEEFDNYRMAYSALQGKE